jgi:hypothetical protein
MVPGGGATPYPKGARQAIQRNSQVPSLQLQQESLSLYKFDISMTTNVEVTARMDDVSIRDFFYLFPL